MLPEELMEAARVDHPQVVEELERLQEWVKVTLGAEILQWNGRRVN